MEQPTWTQYDDHDLFIWYVPAGCLRKRCLPLHPTKEMQRRLKRRAAERPKPKLTGKHLHARRLHFTSHRYLDTDCAVGSFTTTEMRNLERIHRSKEDIAACRVHLTCLPVPALVAKNAYVFRTSGLMLGTLEAHRLGLTTVGKAACSCKEGCYGM